MDGRNNPEASQEEKTMYTVREQQNKNIFTGQVKSTNYVVESENGIYSTLNSKDDADIVCYGR